MARFLYSQVQLSLPQMELMLDLLTYEHGYDADQLRTIIDHEVRGAHEMNALMDEQIERAEDPLEQLWRL